MFKYAVVIALAGVTSALSAKAVVLIDTANAHAVTQEIARTDTHAAGQAQAATLSASAPGGAVVRSADGHYWAEADVDGKAVRFLVDTGATAVALTPEDALRLGYPAADLKFDYSVQTAAGPALAAKIALKAVSVSGIEVADVEAYVIEKGLTHSLLGMTYLGRLSRFEATQNGLILRG